MAPILWDIVNLPPAPPGAHQRALMTQIALDIQRQAEDWYHQTRRKYAHSRLVLEPVVLKPTCDDCLDRLGLPTTLERCMSTHASEIDAVVLPEKTIPGRIAIYDRGKRLIHLWSGEPESDWWSGVQCSDWRQTIEDNDDIFSVYEEPFADYFGLPNADESPKTLRGRKKKAVRDRIVKIYGPSCFECGKKA